MFVKKIEREYPYSVEFYKIDQGWDDEYLNGIYSETPNVINFSPKRKIFNDCRATGNLFDRCKRVIDRYRNV